MIFLHRLHWFLLICLSFLLMGTHGTLLHGQSLDLRWNASGDQAVYAVRRENGQQEIFLVDVPNRQRRLAFDHSLLATALETALDESVAAKRLPIGPVEFAPQADQFLLNAGGKRWLWDNREQTLALAVDQPAPRSQLFLPPRRSGRSDVRTSIQIDNQLDQAVELIWIATDGKEVSYGKIPANSQSPMSTYVGHVWLLRTSTKETLGCYASEENGILVLNAQAVASVNRRPAGRTNQRSGQRGRNPRSPDGRWRAFLRDHNLWLEESGDSPQEHALSKDGSPANQFQPNRGRGSGSPSVYWSPDSQSLLAIQTAPVNVREVHFIESTPADQLQPKLKSYSYPKPGDPFPQQTWRLFIAAEAREIPVDSSLFPDPYALNFLGWTPDSSAFRLLYNQRGHQVLRLLEVDAKSGAARVLAEETSPTFIHYSDRGKRFHRFLPDEQLVWASERSGWNHLYLIDAATGKLRNPITSGDWNVKRVERIDEATGTVWFYAVGVDPEQDPYHEHFCRVQLDGSGFRVMTPADGTHKVDWEQERKYLLDTWSRVDLAPVHELRDGETGELIAELVRGDAGSQFRNRRLTERFTAPGRDGVTPIWGIIHFPRNFDPSRKYPIVEQIYAGPHDQHVPKSFRRRYGAHRIADAGMIVVQIDGMGTAWRSKAFHDVCYKNLRDAGFPDRIAWLKAAAKQFPAMDLERVGIFGGSAGGQNAMAALLWHHDFYQVAIADCGCHDNRMDKRWWNEQWMGYPIDESYVENSNMENAHLLKGDLMLIVGEADRNVDPASTTQVVSRLIKANKDFEFVLVPGAGHGAAGVPWAARKQLEFLKRNLDVETVIPVDRPEDPQR